MQNDQPVSVDKAAFVTYSLKPHLREWRFNSLQLFQSPVSKGESHWPLCGAASPIYVLQGKLPEEYDISP
jgi:hypothetical protein